MTIPVERTRAVIQTREFLFALLDPKKTPRVRSEIRKQAYWCLRHYPGHHDLVVSARRLPDTWGLPSA